MAGYPNIPLYSRLSPRGDFLISNPTFPDFRPRWRCRRFALELRCDGHRKIYLALFSPYQIQLQCPDKHIPLPVLYMFGEAEGFDMLQAREFADTYLGDRSLDDKEVVVFSGFPCSSAPMPTRTLLQELQHELCHFDLIIPPIVPRNTRPPSRIPKFPMTASELAKRYPRIHLCKSEIENTSEGTPSIAVPLPAVHTTVGRDSDSSSSDSDSTTSNATTRPPSSSGTKPSSDDDENWQDDVTYRDMKALEEEEKEKRGKGGKGPEPPNERSDIWDKLHTYGSTIAATALFGAAIMIIGGQLWRRVHHSN
ncbi:hypothetical protein DACRYDRAFT_112429 [Dacryopinax primogenitus]|uniref:Uncharacterized protein n=1 Tax=Dacryopinax primogenitus (strain DJM 731) TaxID=1858805 RepID=M5FZ86_DACPD|nr:uncharacterized protein DACRYDRAFT_112429 [Dacryopinax primogenitus]EJT96812.1 hypothetical protein DACRYDRAFT_112429 [Dacryopinax primogenitus]